MDNQAEISRASAWQATLPTYLLNLGDKWQEAANISTSQIEREPKQLTTEGFFVLCLILLFLIPSVIGSTINAYESLFGASPKKKISPNVKRRKDESNGETIVTTEKEDGLPDWKENCRKFFDCFCIQTNARKLLRITSSPGYLDCIDGIRTILFFWIYLTHFFVFYGSSAKNVDQYIPVFHDKALVKFAGHAVFVLDAFIILSAFLTGYLFSDYYDKHNRKVPWILFYAVRFLRVLPLYIVLLGFYATLFTYISSSPIWPTYNTNPVCKENWIWNILFLNNFLSQYKQCMGMTWFLACAMQLHVISPLFLLPLKRWPKVGYALSVVAIFCSCIATYLVTIKHSLFNILPKTLPDTKSAAVIEALLWKNVDELNQKTYVRLIPYLIGLMLGVYLHGRNPSKKNNLLTLIYGWIMFAFLMWFCIVALNSEEETPWLSGVYNAVKIVLFSCCFSWIIYVCVTQQGGLIGRLISHPIFKPISRLSFCAYLTQTMLFEGYFLSVEVPVGEEFVNDGFFDTTWFPLFGRMFLWTFVVSFIVSVLFEYPVIRLLQTYFAGKKKTE